MGDSPADLKGLFSFYYEHVKPLYSSVQADNRLTLETLFELNAAFDHISRIYQYGDDEAKAVDKACSHLKRSCLDIFKIRLRQITDEYHQLQEVDVGVIDNGQFELEMIALYEEIRKGGIEARRSEGHTVKDSPESVSAFDRWGPVFEKCEIFHSKFFLSKHIEWAKRKQRRRALRERAWDWLIGGVVLALLVGLADHYLWDKIKARYFPDKPAGAEIQPPYLMPNSSGPSTLR